jgi:anti-sigma B factor antagonist
MDSATNSFGTRSAASEVTIIDIVGEITAASEAVLKDAHSRTEGSKIVVLNFSGLDYMNSSGIGLLVTMLIRAKRNSQTLRACGLSDHYRQILSLTRLDEAIAVFESEEAAVAA